VWFFPPLTKVRLGWVVFHFDFETLLAK
jgi:hypothetical protein